ncbi:hypothetical protein PR048_017493 [Dryococelus australis]|uniref:Secreted protein n=1 Tax=Dryococelus australis TaxID=614101 RepID=A0ABQ9H9W0_9NEOP|nr:hypothetical protein PR048_017493 [Dryococelus australis]
MRRSVSAIILQVMLVKYLTHCSENTAPLQVNNKCSRAEVFTTALRRKTSTSVRVHDTDSQQGRSDCHASSFPLWAMRTTSGDVPRPHVFHPV